VPDDLARIRAYVRWEEAGKPQNSSPQWQEARARSRAPRFSRSPDSPHPQEEFLRAREDLRRELQAGVSLNDIRRRYKKPTVEGDDRPFSAPRAAAQPAQQPAQPPAPPPPAQAPVAGAPYSSLRLSGKVERRGWDLRSLLAPSSAPAPAQPRAPPPPPSPLQALAQAARAGEHGCVEAALHTLSLGCGQLLVELRSEGAARTVVFTSDAALPLVLHWGVSRADPGQWLLPPERMRPAGSEATVPAGAAPGGGAAETPMRPLAGQAGLQRLEVTLEGDLEGLQFVLRSPENGAWLKNGDGNFRASFAAPQPTAAGAAGAAAAAGRLGGCAAAVMEKEASDHWWSLMHRFQLCRQLLEGALAAPPAEARLRLSQMLVWLRLSSQRHLTWQRNYNVKPRELAEAQRQLGLALAAAWAAHPPHRALLRAMLATMGRGGEGGDGQRVRDEILHIMHRRGIKEVAGTWMEEWHQKLHNNTTPDDVALCEAYLAFLRARGAAGAYWAVLRAAGLSRARLESYERPIVCEPEWPGDAGAEALARDFESYLSILKAVHAGADLEQSLRLLGPSLPPAMGRLAAQLRAAAGAGDVDVALEASCEARCELRASLLSPASARGGCDPGLIREALFLDLALEDAARRAVEGGGGGGSAEQLMRRAGWAAEQAALSWTGEAGEHVLLALLEWRRVQALGASGDWALRACAGADRLRCALAAEADAAGAAMQPFAEALGGACGVPPAAVRIFSEEVVRGGSGFALSLALTRLDGALRAAARLGAWTLISPVAASGELVLVPDLASVQAHVYARPTVLLAERVGGGEELPEGCVALLTPSSVDVLSHAAVRARNLRATFASCHDPALLDGLRALAGRQVEVKLGGADGLSVSESAAPPQPAGAKQAGLMGSLLGAARPRALPAARFDGRWALPLSAFRPGLLGGKSNNTAAMRAALAAGALPPSVHLPASVAVPFGAFEAAMDERCNGEARAALRAAVAAVDLSSQERAEETLGACRAAAQRVACPPQLREALLAEMRAARMPDVPAGEGASWDACFSALRDVWASKWNVRAALSLRQAGLEHGSLRMAVLVQRVVAADYAFVLHTVNPATGDADELYGELVAGLGETLVGNFPGRALAFSARKRAGGGAETPVTLSFPSKCEAMRVPPTFIFRSDSNGEDLEGYAGAGLYDSVPAREPQLALVDYSQLPLVWDDAFRQTLLQRIADAGLAVESALGAPQDIEGCVLDGEVYLVQTRPQV